MKKILILGTGGTIASIRTPEGLVPMLNSTQLLEMLPAISEFCQVECRQVFSLDSTNIRPGHWVRLAACIRDNYEQYDGFVSPTERIPWHTRQLDSAI